MASSSHVKPNENGYIVVKVSTANRKGNIVENVDVMTNDSAHPQITLTIKAYVIEMFFLPK